MQSPNMKKMWYHMNILQNIIVYRCCHFLYLRLKLAVLQLLIDVHVKIIAIEYSHKCRHHKQLLIMYLNSF